MTIETLGEQGDGIKKVEHGYVVIVLGAHPGAAPSVEIEQGRPTVAFASIVGSDPRTLSSLSPSGVSGLAVPGAAVTDMRSGSRPGLGIPD